MRAELHRPAGVVEGGPLHRQQRRALLLGEQLRLQARRGPRPDLLAGAVQRDARAAHHPVQAGPLQQLGVEVEQALAAAEALSEQGISAEVIDAFSIKPLDEETILASVGKTGCVVTAEEHSIIGGLGSAVAEALVRTLPVPMEFVGMNDQFCKSGEYEELSSYFKMDSAAIGEAVKKVIARK